MTAPLVPVEVDLRGLSYMPLDVNRLRDSDLAIVASPEEFRAAVFLWCASWNQVPAASLPDDDKILAAYAGYGRDLKGWKKVKAGALRGFVHCDDGRLYHPVVAEKALEAWDERLEYRDKRDNEAERLRRHREEHQQLRTELRSYGVTAAWNEKIEALRERVQYERQQRGRTEPETRTGPLPATAKKGREGKGLVKSEKETPAPSASDPPPADEPKRSTLAGDACLAMRKAGCVMTNPGHPELLAALSEGVTPEELGFAVVEARDRGIDHPFVYAIKAARTLHATKASPAPTSLARAGPRQQNAAPGKTVQALQNLEAMKSGPDLDQERNLDRLSEAGHAQLGASAIR